MTCRRCWWRVNTLVSFCAQQQRHPMPVPRWPDASSTSQREHKAPTSLSRCQGGVQKIHWLAGCRECAVWIGW
ncbi:hypothetical protein FIBSPDRAFT_176677 [Athelia psychrophila]|uniref:Uncharacterized protein n=1 Tax=Athelia psychrophila TaxID=1759441 RepID=A0A166SMS1_9AGAM|nr:hypothetical protein FIBSPDRAFT_176677 [Fibularhizoctonia sp. CBS 109695]